MAIYHLSMKPISRSSGRSAVASIAYRAGIEIADERLGKTYDYTKRSGVLWTGLATPQGFEIERSKLWNTAEKIETRKNSRTAREVVINIPHELMQGDQSAGKMLAYEFANHLSQKYKVAVDIAVHAPDKQGDERNYHAHLLLTTRQIEQSPNGFTLTHKSQLEMSDAQLKQAGLLSGKGELKQIRKEWADLANDYLAEHNINTRIDHRSHKDRGLETLPTVKMGWQATELERKGIRTDVGDKNRAIKAHNAEIERKNQLKADTVNQKTHDNRSKIAIEPRKNKSAINVPPTPKTHLKTQNKAVSERFKLTSAQLTQRQEFLAKFQAKIQEIAEKILKTELKALQIKAKPLLTAFEKLRDNEPLYFGKDRWKQDKQQALDRYNAVKTEHDTKRDKGITDEHRKQANQQLEHDEPQTYATAKAYMIDLAKHKNTIKQEYAESLGADTYAKTKQAYTGKIIQSNDKGTLQETQDGIIYHKLVGLEVGQTYTLSHDQSNYTIQKQPDMSYWLDKYKTQDQDRDKER